MRIPLLVAALSTVLGLGPLGCGGGGEAPSDDTGFPTTEVPTGAVEGRIRLEGFFRGVILEAEPNDAFGEGQSLGRFHPGQRVSLVGSLDADGGADLFDGFRVGLARRLRVTATVRLSQAEGLGLMLGVYDPAGLQFVEAFPLTQRQEVVTFHGKGSFDLVLTAAQGAVDYEIVLDFQAAGTTVTEREPNDEPGRAQYLGEVLVGDVLGVRGNAEPGADPIDAVLVSCPAATRLACELERVDGARYALPVLDASTDLTAPTPLATFQDPDASVQGGAVEVPAGTLLHVELEATFRGGAWTLRFEGGPPAAPKPLAAQGVRAPAPLSAEVRRLGGGRGAYGRPRIRIATGEALVGWHPDARSALEKALVGRSCRVEGAMPGAVARVRFDVGALDAVDRTRRTLSRLRGLEGIPGARYAEPNHLRQALLRPDDTHLDLQWHYDMVHLPDAWDVTTGSLDVTVAVLDTGQFAHPDLPPIHPDGYDFISSAAMSRDGDGFDSDPTDPGDLAYGSASSFHGTHVAGTVAARTNNGSGVAGVCWSASLMTLRVLGQGGGTDYDIANAIRYAARLSNAAGVLPTKRADVINMSLGGPGYSQTLADACAAARAAGVLVIASAGNDGSSTPLYPAAYPGVVSVSSVGSNGLLAPYSSFGSTIDIAAPGGNSALDLDANGYGDAVLSTWADDFGGPATPVYAFLEGTSMAAPHVAGIAALMLSVAPGLSPQDLEDALFSTSADLGVPGRDDRYGHGLVDANAAVRAVAGTAQVPPRLAVFPTLLNFGTTRSALDAAISNLGDGFLEVTAVSVSTRDGGSWLQAQLAGAGDASQSADRIRATVERRDLAPGTYRGSVTVTSNGGEAVLEALMVVPPPEPLPPPDLNIHILAVRVDTGIATQRVVVNPAVDLDYTFASLAVGAYTFVAGTDLDGDGEVGEVGEYVGAYPVQGAPVVVDVVQNLTLTRLDFALHLLPRIE